MTPHAPTTALYRPLVITQDDDLLDDLLRIAAAAGTEIDVAHAPALARPYWTRAPVVVVGDDMADALAAADPPQRSRVLLVTRAKDDPDMWRRCVAVGAQEVLDLPSGERRLVNEFADTALTGEMTGLLVCVVGGRGGAGASVLAVSLARSAARRRISTLLVDADPLGGGIDVLLGQEDLDGSRWAELVEREGRINPGALREALPASGHLSVLAFHRGDAEPVPAEAMRSVLEAARRGFDLVVVDLPRHLDPATTEALARATTTLLLVPAEVRGVLASAQVLSVLKANTGDIRAVVRPGILDEDVVVGSLGVPAAGVLNDQPRLAVALNRGDAPPLGPKTPLGLFCESFLDTILSEQTGTYVVEHGRES
ncbi:secretion/DNA translocation related CpaE-like protein [Thermocatellispora tengchongensis]|uniref:Secretion/DNA translocation related CpaE-like protein n=1 Tax=Thermocatellispora tengchongensis TaxID=1073253 RepID=A0A840PIA3_9ACTN|nr:septum site-determining protein Ssd [Thermocatellispora tengchongensis]MBB5137633.1 secretion/DNA translocation related CpaE-like protein [Thermocatellispora tengchongensis]